MKRNTIVLGIVLLLLAIFAWAGWANWEYRRQAVEKQKALQAQKDEQAAESAIGTQQYSPSLLNKPAPALVLEDLKGNKVSLASYKGKAVLVNFWATWCGPCKIETPWIVELRNQYAPQGFEVLGISTEGDDLAPNDKAGWAKDKAAIAKFVAEEHMPYPVLINGDSVSSAWGGLDAMPTSFYVDRNGTVVAAQMGITSKDDMEAKIKKALGAQG
ncbi:MAG TPA: TlpA disulfide reductase family protein [Terracidiphilus sp.]|nr:TlpA disulfide reductase family protein [Terracidiphilus sp.]